MIDLRRLHVLRIVDQLGTVTAAAHALHLTPSAVSQQLRALAGELGLPLLQPDGRRVRLTPAAHALLQHADDLAARWERARAELEAYTDWTGGTLRLGGFPSSIETLLAPAAADLRAAEPRLTVRITEVETADAYRRLLAEDIDVAVVIPGPHGPTVDNARFEQHALLDEPQDLLVPPEHPLARRTEVSLTDAAREPWVLAEPGTCDQYDIAVMACVAAGFTPDVAHEAKEWATIAALVAYGLGVSLMPRLVRVPDEPRVARVRLSGPTVPRRQLLTCVRRGSHGARHVALGLDALRTAAARVDDATLTPAA